MRLVATGGEACGPAVMFVVGEVDAGVVPRVAVAAVLRFETG